jgi:hypothetical protein
MWLSASDPIRYTFDWRRNCSEIGTIGYRTVGLLPTGTRYARKRNPLGSGGHAGVYILYILEDYLNFNYIDTSLLNITLKYFNFCGTQVVVP